MKGRCSNKNLLLCILLLMAADSLVAGPARFKVNTMYLESGPSRDWVNTVQRDAMGYLWIGTENGLRRYDGYKYTIFTSNPEDPTTIGASSVWSFLIDSEQRLWAGGRTLSVFNSDTETFDNYPLTSGNVIWGMAEGPGGILWFGAEIHGLIGFDMNTRQKIYHSLYDSKNRQAPDSITEIINDRKDPAVLWMTATSGLFRFDTRTREFQRIYSTGELGNIQLTASSALRMDRGGKIWMTSEQGLFVIDPENRSFRRYRHEKNNPRSPSTDFLTAILIDSKDQVWIGTDKQGVHLYRPETDDFLHIPASASEPGAFGPAAINEIYEDEDGSLWFSVGAFGVQRISRHLEKFITIGAGPGDRMLSWDLLMDLLEDRNGDIWIATDGGGLNRYNPATGRITRYFHDPENPRSLSTNSVLSLAEDGKGRIWAGTWAGGLNRFDPKTGGFIRYQHDREAPVNRTPGNNNIFQIDEDNGWLWLSLWNFGLQRFNPDTGEFETFHYNNVNDKSGLINGSINAIEISRDGQRWIGHYTGLQKYDPRTRRFTRVPLGDKNHEIFDLYEDPQGILWIGASVGLLRHNPLTGEVKHYTMDHGLPDAFVASIEQDAKGRLWLGTRGGLSLFDPARETFETFDKFDGLPANEFGRYSHLRTRDGLMYFGGNSGLVIFDPENLPRNTHTPAIVLTGLELFQKPVVPGESPYLPRQINLLDRLELPYAQRDVTFEFSALDFIAPMKNRYRYRLQGLENNWTEVDSSRRRARYTNLDPGKYQFQVIGSNNDDVWNETGNRLDVVIVPPWWMTWWARLLAVLLGACAIYGFTIWRLRVVRQHARELFHIAYHDALTGLPNRLWLLERLEEQIRRTGSEPGYRFALMFLDGDRFKQINDTYGHQLGDSILDLAASRLQGMLPKKYQVARLGGDEFTVLVESVQHEDEIIEVCEKILEAFNQPLWFDKNPLFFKVSIGLVFCGTQYNSPGQILRDADIAMYKAKERGRGTWQLFDSKMHEQALEMAQTEADLYKALEQNQLFLVYQPIVDLQTGKLSGFEALVRWRHPQKGLIPPDKFISIAEESGLIFTMGAWVLHQACMQLVVWIKEYKLTKPPTIAVNLSSLQLNQSYFLAQNSESVNLLLDELRARNIELAIDDFGTGYSSLSYLDQLPVQVLKIDRKFVAGMTPGEGGKSSVEIVKATISLAHSLSIMVVAEGIETLEQYKLLKSYRCDFGQGYYIARPLSSEDAARFMGHEPSPLAEVQVDNSILMEGIPKPHEVRRRRKK
jgi:diguanylate cyclase (GGDEF)-like protein